MAGNDRADDANRPQNVTLLQTGTPESEVLDISFFAGRSQLVTDGRNNDPSRTSIRNVVVQLADGSRVWFGQIQLDLCGSARALHHRHDGELPARDPIGRAVLPIASVWFTDLYQVV